MLALLDQSGYHCCYIFRRIFPQYVNLFIRFTLTKI